MIADPDLVNKVPRAASGSGHCVGANQGCVDRMVGGLPITCFHNPDVGREGRGEPAPADVARRRARRRRRAGRPEGGGDRGAARAPRRRWSSGSPSWAAGCGRARARCRGRALPLGRVARARAGRPRRRRPAAASRRTRPCVAGADVVVLATGSRPRLDRLGVGRRLDPGALDRRGGGARRLRGPRPDRRPARRPRDALSAPSTLAVARRAGRRSSTPYLSVGAVLGFTHVNDVLQPPLRARLHPRAEHGLRRRRRAARAVTRHVHTRQVRRRPLRRGRGRVPGRARHLARGAVGARRRASCSWRATRSRRARRCTRSARATTRGGRHEGPGDRGDDARRHARRAPRCGGRTSVAVAFTDVRVTAAELLARSRAHGARGLHALGVRRGDSVGDRDAELHRVPEALFGGSLLGAVVVTVNARYRADRAGLRDRRCRARRPADERRARRRGRLRRAAPRGAPGPRHRRRSRGARARRDARLRACVMLGASSPEGFLDRARLRRPAPSRAGERGRSTRRQTASASATSRS